MGVCVGVGGEGGCLRACVDEVVTVRERASWKSFAFNMLNPYQCHLQGSVNDPLSSLLFQPPGSQSAASSQVSMSQATPTSSDMVPTPYLTTEASRTVISSPAAITMEENAATAQHILDEYNRVHTVPPVRKDLNYSFPEGLFTNEVNLVGSEYPYRHILQEFHNPAEFTDLFKQVPANPFNLPSAFEDLDLIV